MIAFHIVKKNTWQNSLSLFENVNALYVTNNTVLIIIFMIVRMIYRYFRLTHHFQDVTKNDHLSGHVPASLHSRPDRPSKHIYIFIWHLIHFCQSQYPDFSNPLKLLHHHVVIRSVIRPEACGFGAAEMVVLSSQHPAVLSCQSLSRPRASPSFSAPFWKERDQDVLCEKNIGTILYCLLHLQIWLNR